MNVRSLMEDFEQLLTSLYEFLRDPLNRIRIFIHRLLILIHLVQHRLVLKRLAEYVLLGGINYLSGALLLEFVFDAFSLEGFLPFLALEYLSFLLVQRFHPVELGSQVFGEVTL